MVVVMGFGTWEIGVNVSWVYFQFCNMKIILEIDGGNGYVYKHS
jgi:hypothetical protein